MRFEIITVLYILKLWSFGNVIPCSFISKKPSVSLILLPWKWRQHVPLKHWYPSTRLHGFTSHKTIINWPYCLKWVPIRPFFPWTVPFFPITSHCPRFFSDVLLFKCFSVTLIYINNRLVTDAVVCNSHFCNDVNIPGG
jgi:hypothetical protein